ncbi:MAG TPA: hypothetical protein VLG73_15385, partial [Shinella sp.]|nr:hypothetical protein [Shinella sp.]
PLAWRRILRFGRRARAGRDIIRHPASIRDFSGPRNAREAVWGKIEDRLRPSRVPASSMKPTRRKRNRR